MLLKLLSATRGKVCQAVVSGKDEGTIGPRIKELGIPVHALNLNTTFPNPLRTFSLRSLVREFRPHVIQGWMYHGNLMASLASTFAQKPAVFWNIRQSLEDVAEYGWKTAAVIRLGALWSSRPAAIIYNSRSGAMNHQGFGFHNTNQIVIANGFDCDVFRPDENVRNQARAELGIGRDTVVVGLVARYDPLKDHCNFLRAAGLVAGEQPDVRFVMVGKGITKEQPELMTTIAELHLQERVLLLGERQDVERITSAFDIACSASLSEGFSNAIGEAMASGIPCVVTDVGDSAYLVNNTGAIVPARDSHGLAAGILQLINTGQTRRRELGAAARTRIESEFSLALAARRYEELYQKHLPPESWESGPQK